jgi:TetR/AcrR family transcriptional regulator, multidrug resistance operon repressor
MSKRKQIMQVALELFIEQGFHGTSVQMIADRASIAAGSLYRYFQGKEDLIRQIYRMSVQMMVEKLFANVQLTEVNFSTYRQMWLNACFGIQSHNPVILFKDLYERSPFLTAEDRVWAQACWQPLDDFYQSGIDCGLFHAMPPCLLAALSLSTVQCAMHEHKFYDFEFTDALKEQMAAASWKAILAEPLDQPGSNK